jgi:hypothetical protein
MEREIETTQTEVLALVASAIARLPQAHLGRGRRVQTLRSLESGHAHAADWLGLWIRCQKPTRRMGSYSSYSYKHVVEDWPALTSQTAPSSPPRWARVSAFT